MTTQTITLACRDYDHTRALADGRIKIDGIDVKFVNISPPSQIFLRMLHDEEFDASEMSLSNYMIALGKGDRRFIAIPVFPSRVFRHAYVWINTRSGIQKPEDLKGKRIGIADYSMTALLFVRGFLQHQYGVMPQDVHWFRRRSEHVSIKIPTGIRIDDIGKNQSLDDLLEAGDLDAVALTSPPRGFLEGLAEIKRLFADPRAVEAEYYRQTKIFPIMHMVVIRRAVYEKNPGLAVRLAEAFETAKHLSFEAYAEGLSCLPWVHLDLEYARQVLGTDFYPYGVSKNLATLEAATLYSNEQGLTQRKFAVNELFAPETLELFV
ncbi:MAG TPA: ABC transporter substrate-binding protein [Candidatus Binatia bacterium]|nr:ABC transporter substrate-binding protein [Candidatus Binatia bacterium]